MPPDLTILAFDTAAAHCAAAVLSGGRVVTRIDLMAKGQAEHLIPMLEDMLGDAGLGWSDLRGIGVGTGPGNFTGVRIAVAAARGLALGLGVPAIGVTGFDVRAFGLPRPVTVQIDAPRGQVYRQVLLAEGAQTAELGEAGLDPIEPLDPAVQVERIARIAAGRLGFVQPRPAPLYVRGPDAAPPRDPPPVVLS